MIIKLIRMNIDYTVTALMFPAIPLLMSVYSNRFHSLSILIRQLHDEHVYEKHIPPEWKKQFINLSGRITLLRWTSLFASFGFLFNMLTVFALYLDEVFLARLIFGHRQHSAEALQGQAVEGAEQGGGRCRPAAQCCTFRASGLTMLVG